MIIGIFGRKRAGKDVTFDVISEVVRDQSLMGQRKLLIPERRKFAEKLYRSVAGMLGLSVADVEVLKEMSEGENPHRSVLVLAGDRRASRSFTMREILERMGTEVGRDIFGESFWVDQAFPAMGAYRTDHVYGATDMRFPNEYDRIKQLCGKVIKVVGTTEIQSQDISGHPSRGSLIEDRYFDWIIDNSERNMDSLRSQVVEMIGAFHDA